jgi:hypothetical protein
LKQELKDIPFYTIHDSILIPFRHAVEVHRIMEEEFHRVNLYPEIRLEEDMILDTLSDDVIRHDPNYLYWIDEYIDVIKQLGFEHASLVDKYNLAMTCRGMEID